MGNGVDLLLLLLVVAVAVAVVLPAGFLVLPLVCVLGMVLLLILFEPVVVVLAG